MPHISTPPGGDGPKVAIVLFHDQFSYPGPAFEGDPTAFEAGDPGVITIPPGQPFFISRGAAERILARCEGQLLRGPDH